MDLSSVFAFAVLFANQSAPITIEEAIEIAKKNSFSVQLAESQARKAYQSVLEARGALGPKVSAGAVYQRNDSAQSFGGVGSSPIDNKSLNLTLNWPLDIAGVTSKLVQAAKVNYEIAQIGKRTAENDLISNVKQAFYRTIQAREQVRVATESRDRAAERLRQTQLEVEQGTRAKSDILRMETSLKQAEGDLLLAENALAQAKAALNVALGREVLTDVNPQESEADTIPVLGSEQELLERAKENRPEVQSLRLMIKSLEYVRLFQNSGMTPSLNLSLQHTRNLGSVGPFSRQQQTVGTVSLSVPIYDSGVTKAKVAQAREDEAQAKINLQQTELGVTSEVHQAYVNVLNAKSRLEVALKQLELAKENYRLTNLRYENGEGIALEVADANTQLTAAQIAANNAKFDHMIALAQLERAIGGAPKEGN